MSAGATRGREWWQVTNSLVPIIKQQQIQARIHFKKIRIISNYTKHTHNNNLLQKQMNLEVRHVHGNGGHMPLVIRSCSEEELPVPIACFFFWKMGNFNIRVFFVIIFISFWFIQIRIYLEIRKKNRNFFHAFWINIFTFVTILAFIVF